MEVTEGQRAERGPNKRLNRRLVIRWLGAAARCGGGAVFGAMGGPAAAQDDVSDAAKDIIEERELTPDDVNAALETYMPSGRWTST